LEPVDLYEYGFQSLATQEGFFPVRVFDKLAVNMTSCFEVEEETGKEDGRQENSPAEMDKPLAALEVILVRLNRGPILSLPEEMRQHMVAALKHQELCIDKVNLVCPERTWCTSS